MNKRWLLVGGVTLTMAGLTVIKAPAAEQEENEVKVSFKEAPSAVRKTLKREAGGAGIETVDKEQKDGKTVYEADAKIEGQNFEIVVGEDGTLISKKPDNEEDEKAEKSAKEEHHKAKAHREHDDDDKAEGKGRHESKDEDREEKEEHHAHAGAGMSHKSVERLLAQIREVREELDKLEHQVKEMQGEDRQGGKEEREERTHHAKGHDHEEGHDGPQHDGKRSHKEHHGDEEHDD
jgi:hypothetical protein